MNSSAILAIALGGSIGAIVRVSIMQLVASSARLPWPTLVVNLIGCFLVGVAWATCEKYNVSSTLRWVLISGGLGAFTTFSTFGLDCVRLIQNQDWMKCVIYLGVSNIVGIGLVAAGLWLGKKI